MVDSEAEVTEDMEAAPMAESTGDFTLVYHQTVPRRPTTNWLQRSLLGKVCRQNQTPAFVFQWFLLTSRFRLTVRPSCWKGSIQEHGIGGQRYYELTCSRMFMTPIKGFRLQPGEGGAVAEGGVVTWQAGEKIARLPSNWYFGWRFVFAQPQHRFGTSGTSVISRRSARSYDFRVRPSRRCPVGGGNTSETSRSSKSPNCLESSSFL